MAKECIYFVEVLKTGAGGFTIPDVKRDGLVVGCTSVVTEVVSEWRLDPEPGAIIRVSATDVIGAIDKAVKAYGGFTLSVF